MRLAMQVSQYAFVLTPLPDLLFGFRYGFELSKYDTLKSKKCTTPTYSTYIRASINWRLACLNFSFAALVSTG